MQEVEAMRGHLRAAVASLYDLECRFSDLADVARGQLSRGYPELADEWRNLATRAADFALLVDDILNPSV